MHQVYTNPRAEALHESLNQGLMVLPLAWSMVVRVYGLSLSLNPTLRLGVLRSPTPPKAAQSFRRETHTGTMGKALTGIRGYGLECLGHEADGESNELQSKLLEIIEGSIMGLIKGNARSLDDEMESGSLSWAI